MTLTLRSQRTLPNVYHSAPPELRMTRMNEVVSKALEKAKRHAKAKDMVISAVDFVNKVDDLVGKTLDAYPPASLAWSGICASLPVSWLPIAPPHSFTNDFQFLIN